VLVLLGALLQLEQSVTHGFQDYKFVGDNDKINLNNVQYILNIVQNSVFI